MTSSHELAMHERIATSVRIATWTTDRCDTALRRRTHPQVSGGDIEEATPDPIPNSEVKLLGADGTATGRP